MEQVMETDAPILTARQQLLLRDANRTDLRKLLIEKLLETNGSINGISQLLSDQYDFDIASQTIYLWFDQLGIEKISALVDPLGDGREKVVLFRDNGEQDTFVIGDSDGQR